MSGIKDQEQIDEMRKRLYSRGFDEEASLERHNLEDKPIDVARSWAGQSPAQATQRVAPISSVDLAGADTANPAPVHEDIVLESIPQRHYRRFVLLGSLAIFFFVAAISGAYFFWIGNKISGENINFSITGPATIGGTETMSIQVAITNQNDVGVEGATLVMKYPAGTRTVTEPIKNVYEERIDVGSLSPGEVKNLPLQVAIFGKENEEKQIEATFEYKIANSDGTFYKVAEPMRFRITSSPVTLQVSSIGKVAAGQPVEINLMVKSNSSKPLKDVLITASFPNGFAFKTSEPKPIYNQNTWKIDELLPEESEKIKISGTVTGLTEEKFAINFSAGASETNNQFIVGSVLAEARTEFIIESPFIAVDINIGGDADRSVILEQGENTSVEVGIKNTLDETVYDMVVEVVPKGNALTAAGIETSGGFYDSNKGVVRWEVANNPNFASVSPGDTRSVYFSIKPNQNKTTSTFEVVVNVYARRVAESSAQEQLIGSVTAEAKYASAVMLDSQANHMTGPVPPKVGQNSTYLVTLVATAGGNDLVNGIVNTSLPAYVEWLNDYSGPGALDYNPVSKQIEWKVGDMKANTRKELVFSVGILPSVSQVGITPVLANKQTMRAVDRFTNTPLTAFSEQVSTELSAEAGYENGNGLVTE